MNRLENQRVYLAGPVDRVPDRGQQWRDNITPFLTSLGLKVFDPLKKPIEIGAENEEAFLIKKTFKESGDYDSLSLLMKTVRNVDLRLVDISDFIIVHMDLDVHMCGTYEELFLANRQKKPIIVHMQQGKQNAPDWLFGTIHHSMIFSCWDAIKDYLLYVHTNKDIKTLNRWYFFK